MMKPNVSQIRHVRSGFLVYRTPFANHYDNTRGKSTSLLNRAIIINSPLRYAPR